MKPASTAMIAALSLGVCWPAFCQTSSGNTGGVARAAGQAIPKLELGRARLGMTFAEWRALPYAGQDDGHVSASCTGVPAGNGGAPLKIVTSERPRTTVACSYVARFGRMAFPQSFALTSTLLANNPEYSFVGGNLSKIEFHLSIDAFDALVALFRARHGSENQTVRDSVTTKDGMIILRVQKVWRLPSGSIRIVDPSSRFNELLVRYESLKADHPSAS